MSTSAARGLWSSRLGFIFAAAGSAIGLGNIWRFPYTAGDNGGGAFVLVYLGFVLLIGIPVLIAELSMGRATGRNPVGAFRKLATAPGWSWVGGLGVLTGFGILAFYSVIAGWTLGYLWKAITGSFTADLTIDESKAIFGQLAGGTWVPILLAGFFLMLTATVVQRGISGGIERTARILMPVFFLLLLIMALRSLTLEGAGEGLRFLFQPDFSKLNAGIVISALGQALFSLSLGMGAMITYGSYLSKKENLPAAGITVAICDTGIAVLAGLIIFPALFHAGAEPGGGPGLVFEVMPTIFDALPAGGLFGIAFYALLAIAALTSTISLLEVIVAYFVDERGWARPKAAWTLTAGCFLLAVPNALSGDFLNIQNIIWGNYSLSIGAFLVCIFVAWRWGVPKALEEIQASGDRFAGAGLWGVLVRFVCPVAVLVILGYIVITQQYF